MGGVLGDRGKAIERTYTTKFGKKVKYTTYECFETDTAKRLARATIRNEYYGMTKAHMGRAFAGAGDSIWQYKGYALQQTLHDWRIFNRMEKGRKRENRNAESKKMTYFLIILGIFIALRLLAEIFPGLKP